MLPLLLPDAFVGRAPKLLPAGTRGGRGLPWTGTADGAVAVAAAAAATNEIASFSRLPVSVGAGAR